MVRPLSPYRWIARTALSLVVLLPLAFLGCGGQRSGGVTLVIISPHREEIRDEVERGFASWLERRPEWRGTQVQIEWLDIGAGSSQIIRYLDERYKQAPGGIGIDILFGAGTDIYLERKQNGQLDPYRLPLSLQRDLQQNLHGVDLYDSDGYYDVAGLDGVLAAFNRSVATPSLGGLGVEMHAALPHHWYGVMLTSLGIFYNRDVLDRIGLAGWTPARWSDLADPRLYGWVSAGDPRMSGSVHMLCEWILQTYGWDQGMRQLLKLGGNARGYARFSDSVSRDVVFGEAAAGGTLDSYAFSAITRDARDVRQGKASRVTLGFVLPKGETILNPDSIAILKGAPQRKLAEAFVEYNLSADGGQQLWMLQPTSNPAKRARYPGAPHEYSIYRLSLMKRVYTESDPRDWSVQVDPFDEDALGLGDQRVKRYNNRLADARRRALDDLFGAWAIDTHDDLSAAWGAVLRCTGPTRERLERELFAPPCTEKELFTLRKPLGDPRQRAEIVRRWQDEAVERYRRVRAEAASSR